MNTMDIIFLERKLNSPIGKFARHVIRLCNSDPPVPVVIRVSFFKCQSIGCYHHGHKFNEPEVVVVSFPMFSPHTVFIGFLIHGIKMNWNIRNTQAENTGKRLDESRGVEYGT